MPAGELLERRSSLSHGRIIFAASLDDYLAQLGVDASERPEHGGETTGETLARVAVKAFLRPEAVPLAAPGARPAVRAKLMIESLQALARTASNSAWVRWWAHWNHLQNPAQMAISLVDEAGRTVEVHELEQRYFEKVVTERGFVIYICDRVDERGEPYVSRLV